MEQTKSLSQQLREESENPLPLFHFHKTASRRPLTLPGALEFRLPTLQEQ